jgi:hypothetical protein
MAIRIPAALPQASMTARLWRYAGPIRLTYRTRVLLMARKRRGFGFPADPTSTEMSMPQGPARMPPTSRGACANWLP